MSSWVDVRIARKDLRRHAAELVALKGCARIDLRPPAAGPEAELSFGPYLFGQTAADRVVASVERLVPVLASRVRPVPPGDLEPPVRDDEGWRP